MAVQEFKEFVQPGVTAVAYDTPAELDEAQSLLTALTGSVQVHAHLTATWDPAKQLMRPRSFLLSKFPKLTEAA